MKADKIEIDKTMRATLLKAPLLISGFVHREEDCNYEIYLSELVNNSSWFKSRYPGGFKRPSSEANGECDVINNNYELDFKLFAASTALRAKNLCEPQITKLTDGLVTYSSSKTKNKSFKATRLFAAFRELTIEELHTYRLYEKREHSIKNDIYLTLKVLETKKNILLFFPYSFTFDIAHKLDEAINSITNGINSDFHTAFAYREEKADGYDTYLTCVYEKQFLLFQIDSCNAYLRDVVNIEKMPTYLKLYEYSNFDE